MTLEGRRLAVPFGVALVFWGLPIALIAPRPYLPGRDPAARGRRRRQQRRGRRRLHAPPAHRPGRAARPARSASSGALAMGAVALGSIAAPAVVAAVGPRAAFGVVGAILPAGRPCSAGGGCARSTGRWLAPAAELDARRRRADVRAALARREGAPRRQADADLTWTPGEVVVRAGDTGDRFYIVDSGELEIANGAHAQRRGRATSSARSRCCATCRAPRPSGRPRRRSCSRSSATTSWPPSRPLRGARRRRGNRRTAAQPGQSASSLSRHRLLRERPGGRLLRLGG